MESNGKLPHLFYFFFNNPSLPSQRRGSLRKLFPSFLSFQGLLYFSESMILQAGGQPRAEGPLPRTTALPKFMSPWESAWPSYTSGTGCSFSSPSTIRMSYGGTILFPGPTLETAPIQSLVNMKPWFLSLQWRTCLWQNCSLGSCACS